jgi:hypothetical protein
MAINLGERLRQVISGTVPRVPPAGSEPSIPGGSIPGDSPDLDGIAIGTEFADPHSATSDDDLATPSASAAARRRAQAEFGPRIADVLAGEWIESREGAVLVVDRFYTPSRMHGRIRIGDIVETLECGLEALRVLGRAWPGRDPRPYTTELCFFDLETTGLAGGAGTQAFLVGTAVLEDGGIRVRQFLLPGFQHERALLTMVADWQASHGTLVTFNGRTFDVPLIETRYLLHRLQFPLGEMPHLDMLQEAAPHHCRPGARR